jgi:hypothetical protein
VTCVGDIEIELGFRIAIRGRMRDLAELTRMLEDSEAVILLPVKEQPKVQASEDKRIVVNIGRSES